MPYDSRAHFYRTYVTSHTRGDLRSPDLQISRQLQQLLPPSRDSRILDVGCGEGALLRAIQSLGYTNAEGIDVSEQQIHLALERGTLNVEQQDALAFLANREAQWDCVLTVDVLEHFSPDEAMLLSANISRALSMGGVWIVQVPNAVSPLFGAYQFGDFTHRSIYTAMSLSQLFKSVGLEYEGAFEVGVASGGGLRRFVRRLIWRTYASGVRLALAAETGQAKGWIVSQNLVALARRP